MSQPPTLQNVAIEVDSQAIAIVKYNRPQKGNALNVPFLKDLLTALEWTESNDAIRIIITTGEGRFYTNGLDFLDPTNSASGQTVSDEFVGVIGKIHEMLINTDKTVISAVNGPAPGWGTSSIALSDLVYSVPEAIFFTPFVQWGICAEGCSSVTFARVMGRAKASALILAGQRFTAAEMESAGLITKILPKENFLEGVLKIARDVAKLPPNSLRLNKNILMSAGGYREELLAANMKEMTCLAEQARRKESLDAVAAFAKATEERKKAKAAKATKL